KPIEIQVRTELQHLWAELSEKLSDIIDPAIKYGGGNEDFQEELIGLSAVVAHLESFDEEIATGPEDFRKKLASLRQDLLESLRGIIKDTEKLKGEGDDISD
ncbi:MAG TPA: hypothetical protein VF508_14745, partial [Pyrinomonadaceae bacterium]